ncbi:MAG: hypothetical protein ACFFE2_07565 [Candidatus Thorarchaeota archaeon]
MKDNQNIMKKYIDGALFLHALVLYWFALDAYFAATRSNPNIYALFASILFGSMGTISVWLSRNDHTIAAYRQRIETWAAFSIVIAYLVIWDLLFNRRQFDLITILPILLFMTTILLIILCMRFKET